MRITAVLLLSREMEISMYPFSHGWPGTSFVGAWGFGRYTPEASAGMTRDSKKTPLRNGGREALAPALSPKIPALMIPADRPGPQARAPLGLYAGPPFIATGTRA